MSILHVVMEERIIDKLAVAIATPATTRKQANVCANLIVLVEPSILKRVDVFVIAIITPRTEHVYLSLPVAQGDTSMRVTDSVCAMPDTHSLAITV